MTAGTDGPGSAAVPAPIEAALRRWLPAQRWFAGKDRPLAEVRIERAVPLLDSDPGLEHLVLAADGERYQVLLGHASTLPTGLAGARIDETGGAVRYAAVADLSLMAELLDALPADGDGPVLHLEPGVRLRSGLPVRPLAAEQSNTSLVFGDRYLLKLFRRLQPGVHPEVELAHALRRTRSTQVAPILGVVSARIDGGTVVLGVLQEFLPDAVDGWTLATAPGAGARADFRARARPLGRALASVHLDLAAVFGSRPADGSDRAAEVARMHRRLAEVLPLAPSLAEHADDIRRVYDTVTRSRPSTLQRVHGDLHLGQVLLSDGRWRLIDFEGEPGRPLAERRAPRHRLHDVATMLRSFDYADHQRPVSGHEPGPPGPTAADAFCDGYAELLPDPRAEPELLHALELDKAVYEVGYESANRPGWLPIPLAAVRTLARRGGRP